MLRCTLTRWLIGLALFGTCQAQTLPPCAQSCYDSAAVGQDGCSNTDISCYCSPPESNNLIACGQAACDTSDLQEAIQYFEALCASIGASLVTTAGNPSQQTSNSSLLSPPPTPVGGSPQSPTVISSPTTTIVSVIAGAGQTTILSTVVSHIQASIPSMTAGSSPTSNPSIPSSESNQPEVNDTSISLESTASSAPSASPSSAGGLSESDKINLGVGIGLGAPGAILACLSLWLFTLNRRRKKGVQKHIPYDITYVPSEYATNKW